MTFACGDGAAPAAVIRITLTVVELCWSHLTTSNSGVAAREISITMSNVSAFSRVMVSFIVAV